MNSRNAFAKTLTAFAVLLTLAFVAGCNKGAAQIVGKWKGKSGEEYTFNQDGTYKQMAMGTEFMSGKWSSSGTTVTIKPEKIMGKDVNQMVQSSAMQAGRPDVAGMNALGMGGGLDLDLSSDGKTLSSKAVAAFALTREQ